MSFCGIVCYLYGLFKEVEPMTNDWPYSNFTKAEVSCKCGCGKLPTHKLMEGLQTFRKEVGVPVILNSVSRCEKHNRSVGGAKDSYHVKGLAGDVRITTSLTRERIHAAAKKVGFLGIGDYPSFVHIDLGPKRYWDSRK